MSNRTGISCPGLLNQFVLINRGAVPVAYDNFPCHNDHVATVRQPCQDETYQWDVTHYLQISQSQAAETAGYKSAIIRNLFRTSAYRTPRGNGLCKKCRRQFGFIEGKNREKQKE